MKPAELLGMKNAERDHLKFGFKKKKEEEASAASQLVTPEQPDTDPPTYRCIHVRAHSITIPGYTRPELQGSRKMLSVSKLSRALHPAALTGLKPRW